MSTAEAPGNPPPAAPEMVPPAGMTGRPGPLLRLVKHQSLAFLLVGGFNTAVGTAWFIAWQLAIGERVGYLACLTLAYLCSVLTSFLTYRHLVFEVRGHFWRDLWRFAVVNFSAFAINMALMALAVELLGAPEIPAQLVITAVIAIASFFGYRDFSFARRGQ